VKLVTAIVKPHRIDQVKEALRDIGVNGLTTTDVEGFGRQRGHTEVYRGAEYEVKLLPKVKLEIAVAAQRPESIHERHRGWPRLWRTSAVAGSTARTFDAIRPFQAQGSPSGAEQSVVGDSLSD
jgi:hypothetical protein